MRRALAAGFDGWVDDDPAFTQPWGFAFDALRVRVTVWQGDADVMVPFATHRDAIVAGLLAGTPPGG